MKQESSHHLLKDLSIIFLSILIAIVLVATGAIETIINHSLGLGLLGSFIAGMFFTSIFTTAPAIAALFEISKETPILTVAFLGALGAMIGDLLIFNFVKDKLTDDILAVLKAKLRNQINHLLKLSYFRWLMVLIGGLIIASPLPDELGLMFIGTSKLNTKYFFILSFTFNFIGILLIGLLASNA